MELVLDIPNHTARRIRSGIARYLLHHQRGEEVHTIHRSIGQRQSICPGPTEEQTRYLLQTELRTGEVEQ